MTPCFIGGETEAGEFQPLCGGAAHGGQTGRGAAGLDGGDAHSLPGRAPACPSCPCPSVLLEEHGRKGPHPWPWEGMNFLPSGLEVASPRY